MPSIGQRGQAAISTAVVRVEGSDLAAEICALYLAGAGVSALEVDEAIRARVAEQNREVLVRSIAGATSNAITPIIVRAGEGDPVLAGAIAARAVLARILAEDAR